MFVVELNEVAVTHVRLGSEMLTFDLEVKFTPIVSNVVQALERESVRLAYVV